MPLLCTPKKVKADGLYKRANHRHPAGEKRLQLCQETQGMFIGPMPPKDFIEKFLLPPSNKRCSLPRVDFSSVPTNGSTEKVMYKPLVEEMNRCCTGFSFYVAAEESGDRKDLRPDIAMVKNSSRPVENQQAKAAYDWKNSEIPCEVKASTSDDAFDDDNVNTVDGRLTSAGRSHRGQLISYYNEQALRQHRTFIIELFIFGPWARFLRFDRSGAVVTRRFNYKDEPRLLVEFLWRYCRLDDRSRGWDVTRSLATAAAIGNYKNQMTEFLRRRRLAKGLSPTAERVPRALLEVLRDPAPHVSSSTGEDTKNLMDQNDANNKEKAKRAKKGKKDNNEDREDPVDLAAKRVVALGGKVYPTYSIEVTMDDEPKTLVFCQPLDEPLSPFGRATRAYLVHNQTDDEILFLKDYWRPNCVDHDSEAEVFEKLFNMGVRHLPKVLASGDVVPADGNDPFQKTFTDTLPQASVNEAWRKSCGELRSHIHHIIVQDVLYPLSSFKNSRELIRVLMDATEAIADAHDLTGILHRDVSVSNIMITLDGEGILNDWDNSGPAPNTRPGRKTAPYRTGTWQYMSIDLLQDADVEHELWHDLESTSVWCLLYEALHHLRHTYGKKPKFNINLFDSVDSLDTGTDGTTLVAQGGTSKKDFLLMRKFELLRFESIPINDLIGELFEEFAKFYWLRCSKRPTDKRKCSKLLQNLGNPSYIYKKLKKAYDRDDWPEDDDWVPDQYPPETDNEQKARLELALAQQISRLDRRGAPTADAGPNSAHAGTTGHVHVLNSPAQTDAHASPTNTVWPATALQTAIRSDKNPRKYGRASRARRQPPKNRGPAAGRSRVTPQAGPSNAARGLTAAAGRGTTSRKRAAEDTHEDRDPDMTASGEPLRRSKRLRKGL